MHELFDKLGYAAKRAAKSVADEVSVAAQKQRLSDCYRDLGKLCYQAMKRGETPDFPAELARIDAALRHLEALKARRNVEPETTSEVGTQPAAQEPDFIIPDE